MPDVSHAGSAPAGSRIVDVVRRVHRWAALVLSPLFAIILISGALLAFEPMLGAGDTGPRAPVDTTALATLLQTKPQVASARAIAVAADGASVTLLARRAPAQRLDLATGATLPAAGGFDFFAVVRELHEGLLIGAKPLVEAAAWVMLGLLLTGPLLAWPRLRSTVTGWHIGLGWLLFPLLLLPVGTATLRTVSGGAPAELAKTATSKVTLADALARAGLTLDLSGLESAHTVHGGVAVVARVAGADWLVTSGGVGRMPATTGPLRDLHDGTWAPPWSGLISLASATALLGLLGTGVYAWARRTRAARQRGGDAGADLLVAHASQTGTAARYAEATAAALRAAGARVATASLAALVPADLGRYRASLLLASSTGEGQLAEPGRGFLRALSGAQLGGVRFTLLELGDRRYRDFCAGGEALRTALLRAGAAELAPVQRADGDPGPAWRAWLADLGARLRLRPQGVPEPEADRPVTLTLASRTRMDDPANGDTREVHALELHSAMPLDWRPGDLVLIAPGEGEAERCYSIGSSARVDDRRLDLTLALQERVAADGTRHLGAASSLLCRTLRPGATLRAKLRRHAAFNPPDDPAQPMIMVAVGCGIAPFMGFLEERAAAGSWGASWLIFGNRHREADFLHAERLQEWLASGVLARLDTAFSRDVDDGRHVQDVLRAQAGLLHGWMEQRGAVLYACGGQATLGAALDESLPVVASGGADAEAGAAVLTRWRAEGRIRCDIFG
jgi:sulfite reductase (NADPH) flavoprotein alpha-component